MALFLIRGYAMNTTLSMFETLKSLNPTLKLHHCEEMAFHKYGTLISDFDFSDMIAMAERFTLPTEGVEYHRSVSELEEITPVVSLSKSFFNNAPLQAGICHGLNSRLNALEWHPSNELLIAASDLVLFLGHVDEMNNLQFDVQNIRAFFVPKGVSLLLFHSTLHFAPVHVKKVGFRAIIILPRLTNAPFDKTTPKTLKDPYLFAVNKWMIAHPDSPQARRGACTGIVGENIIFTSLADE